MFSNYGLQEFFITNRRLWLLDTYYLLSAYFLPVQTHAWFIKRMRLVKVVDIDTFV